MPATINNGEYIATFDVEVHPRTNNYRTHKVINEIDLTPIANATALSSTDTGPAPAVNDNSSSLSTNSIPNSNENVNVQQENTTSRTMAEDIGLGGNTVGTVAELESKVRGYNESITQKSDLPTEIKNEFINNPQMYEVLSNKTTLENAEQILSENDTNGAIVQFNRLVDQKNPVAVPLGYNLSKQLQAEGRFDEAVEVLRKMSEKLTEAGQFTQAAAITLMV